MSYQHLRFVLIIALVVAGSLIAARAVFPPRGAQEEVMEHTIAITDERAFLREMIPHHQEAVDTSQLLLTRTQDGNLRPFAEAVINVQTREIRSMTEWLQSWYGETYQGTSTYQPMMGDLTPHSGRELEKLYVVGMIRHHEGAVAMAHSVLQRNPRDEVRQMAEAIIATQTQEIATLKSWLSKYQDVELKDTTKHEINVH